MAETITVRGPFGLSEKFPKGTDVDTINRVMAEKWAKSPQRQMDEQASKMSHADLVDAYRKTRPGDPWGDFLGTKLEQQMPGETAGQRDRRIGKGDVSAVSKGDSALAGFADVGNYGLWDEGAAALDSLLGRGTYDQALNNRRLQQAELRDTNPKSYTAGEIGGAVPLTAQALLAAPAATTLPGMAAVAAGEGAIQGGAYGFGSGEGASDRLWKALEQAGIGATIGAAAPYAGRAVGSLYRTGREALMNNSTVRKASNSVWQMLQDNGLTLDDARKLLGKMGIDASLADISPGMRVEAAGTAIKSPEAQTKMVERFGKRDVGTKGRVKDILDKGFGQFKDPQTIADEVTATQKSTGPAYELAKQHIVDSEGAVDLIRESMKTYGPNSDTGQALSKYLSQLVDAKGNIIGAGNIVHGVRQEVDAALRRGNLPNSAPFKALRNKLDEVLKTQVPGFKEADKTWSGAQRVQEAFDYGQGEVMTSRTFPGQFEKKWTKMSDPEKAATMQGSRADIEMSISGAPNASLKADRKLSQNMNDVKLRRMLDENKPGAYDKIADGLDTQQDFRATFDLVDATRGSKTAPVTAAGNNRWGGKGILPNVVEAAGQAGTATAAGGIPGGITSVGAQVGAAGFRKLLQKITGVNPKVIAKAGDLLSTMGPEALRSVDTIAAVLKARGVAEREAKLIASGVQQLLKSAAVPTSAALDVGGAGR